MTLVTILKLNNDFVEPPFDGCTPVVVKLDDPLGGVFGDGERVVEVRNIRIPPQLEQVVADDPNIELVYYLLRRYCTAFPPDVVDLIERIRAKVVQTQDLSLLTDDELRIVRTLNSIYNSDMDGTSYSTTTVPSS